MRTLVFVMSLACGTAVLGQPPEGAQTRSGPKERRVTQPAAVAQPQDVLAVQVALDRLGFSPGEIDGNEGNNFRRAVAAYQRASNLAPSGQMDPPTSALLAQQSGGQPAIVPYELTAEDVTGPFAPAIPEDLMAQARLQRLDYRNALEALAEKVHASPALLKRLNPGVSFTRAGEQVQVPNLAPIPPTPGPATPGANAARIVVTEATGALTVEDDQGRIIFHAPVTSGSQHDPLPIGSWKVTSIHEMPPFHYNPDLFWDANENHAKARIPPGPNNPVGVTWIDISKEHYGIHGTPEPSRVGHAQSHGCIRLTNWDVRRVAQWARPGMPVVFQ